MSHRLKIAVDEFTTPNPTTVDEEKEYSKVLDMMEEQGIRHVVVVKDNKPTGIVSERDGRFFLNYLNVGTYTARDVMTPKPYCVKSGTPMENVVFEMSQQKIGSAIVLNADGTVAGIFTATDALNALLEIIRGDLEEDGGEADSQEPTLM